MGWLMELGYDKKTLFGSLVSYKACAKASDLTRAEVAQLQRDWRSCFSTPPAILASSSLSWSSVLQQHNREIAVLGLD